MAKKAEVQEVITAPDAMKFMQQIVDGKREHEVCPKTLDLVIMQHHNIYLRYISMRDLKRSK